MSAKAYDKKTAAFAGFLIQNVPTDLTDEAMDGWMANPEATKKFLTGLKPPEKVGAISAPPTPLFSLATTFFLGAVAGKPTKECFTDSRFVYRDYGFDTRLPSNQPQADACVITALASSRDWTFAEAAAFVLGISLETSVKILGDLLKERGHTMTLAQAEEMVKATERSEKTGMRTDGYGTSSSWRTPTIPSRLATSFALFAAGTRTSIGSTTSFTGTPAAVSLPLFRASTTRTPSRGLRGGVMLLFEHAGISGSQT